MNESNLSFLKSNFRFVFFRDSWLVQIITQILLLVELE